MVFPIDSGKKQMNNGSITDEQPGAGNGELPRQSVILSNAARAGAAQKNGQPWRLAEKLFWAVKTAHGIVGTWVRSRDRVAAAFECLSCVLSRHFHTVVSVQIARYGFVTGCMKMRMNEQNFGLGR
ncbi:hypothetical protein OU994_01345 [Pseudoduganella sp. SL102]|uniref:hypothetical protein n=1 Tax=Pseudoduganella sp. SL102 TaxID=2995154 RepID=UPI00248B15F2|nr:hypothetical protein [Pseudoduganella sp. SL102]WBS02981.1 hypothetical protein OU994_01345 [Pseudoduganella sp. SL102]